MYRMEPLSKRRQAPYLQRAPPPPEGAASPAAGGTAAATLAVAAAKPGKAAPQQEADAAAGGAMSFTRRVSSFSLLPRVQSTDALSKSLRQSQIFQPQQQQQQEDADRTREPSDPLQPKKPSQTIEPDWRLRDRMKTIGVGLILALNIGTDPPDLTKPHPCAVQECWIDPRSVSRSKAKEIIGERLEMQYARWQLVRTARPLKHRRALDPTVEDVRALCVQLRRQARNERILIHYNGHGVPRPTANGEIWVFDKNHTEYIPLGILDLRTWMGKPSIVVVDCSAAGILIPFFKAPLEPIEQLAVNDPNSGDAGNAAADGMEKLSSQWVNDTIVLCPCSENEWLPMSPDYPADIFTSCLTTPIPIALRWFVRNHPTSMGGLDPDAVDGIPGKANDRKTPLGELNWIFTAVTDSIAWNMLPKPIFQRLFRQDLLVASMFRNFLLADRILRSLGCTPVSHPPLPPGMAEHPLWRAWDLVCETLLFQLMKDGVLGNHVITEPVKTMEEDDMVVDSTSTAATAVPRNADSASSPDPNVNYSASSPFFSEQLTAFEVWLEFASIYKMQLSQAKEPLESPEQLPVVLQVLLSQVHRIRALLLLRRFLDLGPWAVNLALSLGIFPYVMKLLQSPEYKSLLVSIWASILAFDPSCRSDLLKEGAFHHFVQHLMFGLNSSGSNIIEAAKERTMAAFILSICCNDYPAGQIECMRLNVHGNCCALLASYEQTENRVVELHLPSHFRFWLVMCLANLIKNHEPSQIEAYRTGVHSCLYKVLNDKDPDVRAAACFALGCLIRLSNPTSHSSSTQDLVNMQQMQPATNFAPQSAALGTSLAIPGPLPGRPAPSTFQPQTDAPNLQWRPQSMDPIKPGQAQPRHVVGASGQQFNNQAQLHIPPGQLTQVPYMMQGHPVQSYPTLASPTGFLTGGSHADVAFVPSQLQHFPLDQQRFIKPSVYEDSQRLYLDLDVVAHILKARNDASVLVRYEAVVSLGYAVSKYYEAFVVVAQERSGNASNKSTKDDEWTDSLPIPRGLEKNKLDDFRSIWGVLRSLQHDDPFPCVAQAANQIVSYIHEHLLHQFRMQSERHRNNEMNTTVSMRDLPTIADIDEEPSGMMTPPPAARFGEAERAKTTGAKAKKPSLRRVLSDGVDETDGSLEKNALMESASSHHVKAESDVLSYTLPVSELYDWKKSIFDTNFEYLKANSKIDQDPLSPAGALKAQHETNITVTRERAWKMESYFASLAPKPPKSPRQSIQMLLEQEEEALEAAEEEAASKRKELELSEKKVLRNEGSPMTAMLRFHSFKDILVSCGGTGAVAVWGTETGSKHASFDNGNPEGSRMTTCGWMNEESSSLFYIGCDDGSVRFWGDLHPMYDSFDSPPSLISAFHALPMRAGQRGSGLVCEWQQWNGSLLAAGNAAHINCWDLEAESLVSQIETKSEANVTTLTTAWDADQADHFPPQTGLGPDTLVAGFSDGALRIFDLRTHRPARDVASPAASMSNPRRRATSYKEHKGWVVATAFVGYASRYELISGTVDGEIKAWDLRMSASLRTAEVQRSTLTALTVHPRIPVAATGSHAQFIKLLTLEGDTLQVLRYHERMASHRIGPVSCLAFHKYKPLLAAGSTDTFIGLYAPKRPFRF